MPKEIFLQTFPTVPKPYQINFTLNNKTQKLYSKFESCNEGSGTAFISFAGAGKGVTFNITFSSAELPSKRHWKSSSWRTLNDFLTSNHMPVSRLPMACKTHNFAHNAFYVCIYDPIYCNVGTIQPMLLEFLESTFLNVVLGQKYCQLCKQLSVCACLRARARAWMYGRVRFCFRRVDRRADVLRARELVCVCACVFNSIVTVLLCTPCYGKP